MSEATKLQGNLSKEYSGIAYLLLAEKLSPNELICISHCTVFDDCGVDGNCKIQDKADKIIKD